jgi:hypothetical protein
MAQILGDNYSFFKSKKVTRDYHTYQFSKDGNALTFQYFIDDRSSSWIKDPETFEKFPQKYQVVSGGWYGDHGRWKTLKRIFREIKCSDITEYKEIGLSDENKLHYDKPLFSNKINVEVNGFLLPTLSFKCADISFTKFYKLMLVDNETEEYVDCTNLFEGGLTFIGKL